MFDIQTGINTHSPFVFNYIHHPESVSPPSCSQLSPLQPESRLMLLPYQRWRCLQLWGKRKRRPGEMKWEGWMGFFYRLAADGTPGVFIPRRRLISAACKSTWQVFTGAVNPADSIHFANCSDAASLSRKDQTLAVLLPRSFVLSSWWKAKFTLCNMEMKGVMKPPWQSDYSCKHVCASLFAAHYVQLFFFLLDVFAGGKFLVQVYIFSPVLCYTSVPQGC